MGARSYNAASGDLAQLSPATAATPALIARAQGEIDAIAERMCLRYITPGSARAMIYQGKEAEARQLIALAAADPAFAPDEADYPLLAAGVGVDVHPQTGVTVASLVEEAELIVMLAGMWRTIGGAIEAVRLAGKRDVATAATAGEIVATVSALTWPG